MTNVFELNTGRVELLVVGLPKGATQSISADGERVYEWMEKGSRNLLIIDNDNTAYIGRSGGKLGDVELSKIGRFLTTLKTCTEEQAAEIVDITFDTPRLYADYLISHPLPSGLIPTAIESLSTLFESAELFTKNPLGEKEPGLVIMPEPGDEGEYVLEASRIRDLNWHRYAQRTFPDFALIPKSKGVTTKIK